MCIGVRGPAQGMLRSVVVGQFFRDLKNPAYTTAFAVYHRRFSTNTTPKWPLAQPMRVLGHNGAPASAHRMVLLWDECAQLLYPSGPRV